MRRRATRTGVLAIGLGLALLGCGGSSDGAAPASTTAPADAPSGTSAATGAVPGPTAEADTPGTGDPCPEATAVAVLLGGDVTRSPVSAEGATGCRYQLPDGDGTGAVVVERLAADGERGGASYDDRRGDRAETTVAGRAGFQDGDVLVVDDGAQPLRITTEGLGPDAGTDAALRVAVAELVLGA